MGGWSSSAVLTGCEGLQHDGTGSNIIAISSLTGTSEVVGVRLLVMCRRLSPRVGDLHHVGQ
jgi:hypothetical protein